MGRRPLAAAHLDTAARLYLDGVEADPVNFYVGLNAVTTLRILAQRLGGPPQRLDQARDLLPVVLWFARTAAEREPHDFWAVVTVAELVLTRTCSGDRDPGRCHPSLRESGRRTTQGRPGDLGPEPAAALRGRRRPQGAIDQIRALFEPRDPDREGYPTTAVSWSWRGPVFRWCAGSVSSIRMWRQQAPIKGISDADLRSEADANPREAARTAPRVALTTKVVRTRATSFNCNGR